jgi:hypothetical protein
MGGYRVTKHYICNDTECCSCHGEQPQKIRVTVKDESTLYCIYMPKTNQPIIIDLCPNGLGALIEALKDVHTHVAEDVEWDKQWLIDYEHKLEEQRQACIKINTAEVEARIDAIKGRIKEKQ